MLDSFFKILCDLIESFMKFCFEFFEEIISSTPKKNKGYNADFISQGRLLSSYHRGFCLNGRKNLTVKDSYQNALIIGGTGVGKSSVVLIPSLYSMEGSFIIHDPSGELYTKTAGYLKLKGYEVKLLNFVAAFLSAGFNPFVRANNLSEIQKLAALFIETSLGRGKDPFWNSLAAGLLTMLISILKKQPQEFQNMYNVRQLLNQIGGSNTEAVDKLFSTYADDALFAEYKSFISYDEKIVMGVIATCKAALQLFNDESVAQVTSFDNLDFSDFRNKKVALFIQNSVADQKYYSSLTSLFFEQFFSFLLSRFPGEAEQDIFLLIDEASSLNLPTLPLAVANVRKHRAGIMLLVQDFNQLVHHYGKYDADAIKANCFSKLYFTGQSHETTKELENTLGRYEYEEEETGKKVVRPLMTNDEIRTMNINRALLVCSYHPPIMLHLKPYYKRSNYLAYSKITCDKGANNTPSQLKVLELKNEIHEEA